MHSRRQLLLPAAVLGSVAAVSMVLFGPGANASTVAPSAAPAAAPDPGGANIPAGARANDPDTNSPSGNPDAVASGKTLFIASCSSCHGADALGSERGPTISGLGPATVDFWVNTGRMPLATPTAQAVRKIPLFTAQQSRAIAAYVTSLTPAGTPQGVPIPTVDLAGASLSQGGELFRVNCATCHSFTANGGALSFGAFAPSLTQDSPLQIAEAVRTGPANMPVFSQGNISNQEMNDIIKYVRYVVHSNNRGGIPLGHIGPTTEGLVGVGLGVGLMMLAAFWIGDRA
jgi:ubiquinol-cytochrome c reductase cytochrome c subunit